MPLAGDPFLGGGGLPISHNPLERISYTPNKLPVTLDDLIDALISWLENILFPAIQRLTGIDLAEFLPALKTIVENLETIFGSLNPASGHFNPAAALQALVNLIVEVGIKFPISLIKEFVGFVANIPIIKQIIGFFTRGLVPITAGSVTSDQPNLYAAPTFPADSIAPGSEWTVDDSSRTSDGTGSAMVVCDGKYHALRSGTDPTDTIAVGGGQTFTPSVYVSHQGYSGVGDAPILLQVVPFNADGAQLPIVTLDTYAPPSADLDWPGHQMTGTYPVPAGVAAVQTRYLITDGALAGTLRFDDASAKRAAQMKKSMVEELEDDLQAGFGQFNAIVDTIVNTFTGVTGVGHELAELENAIISIPAHFIQGIGGAVNMEESITSGWDALVSGLLGRQVSNVGAADIYNAALQTSGTAGADQTWYFVAAGSQVCPDWGDFIDVVVVGEGQPGINGAFLYFGQGGHPGKWNATTWRRGTDYTGTPTVSFIPETSGNGTPVISIPGRTISAAPGSGTQSPNGAVRGVGPGPYEYNGQIYRGGGDQTSVGGPNPAGSRAPSCRPWRRFWVRKNNTQGSPPSPGDRQRHCPG